MVTLRNFKDPAPIQGRLPPCFFTVSGDKCAKPSTSGPGSRRFGRAIPPAQVVLSAPGESVPSDTKLLLTKNYFEIILFDKSRISRVISGKSLSFPEISRGQIPSKITKNNSQGIIFVIISCQRVDERWFGKGLPRNLLLGLLFFLCSGVVLSLMRIFHPDFSGLPSLN